MSRVGRGTQSYTDVYNITGIACTRVIHMRALA